MSPSAIGAALMAEAVHQKLHAQHAILLQPMIKQAVREQMAAFVPLLVRVAFEAGQTRSLVTNILGRQPGVSPAVLKTILEGSGESAKANITAPDAADGRAHRSGAAMDGWGRGGTTGERWRSSKPAIPEARQELRPPSAIWCTGQGWTGRGSTRKLQGYDGVLEKLQAYQMIDEAGEGTYFYRLIVNFDKDTEDAKRDLYLGEIIEKTMLHLEDRFQKQLQFVATEHDDHTPLRHVHMLALLPGKLNVQDLAALRGDRDRGRAVFSGRSVIWPGRRGSKGSNRR